MIVARTKPVDGSIGETARLKENVPQYFRKGKQEMPRWRLLEHFYSLLED